MFLCLPAPLPGRECGVDPTEDALDCQVYPPCGSFDGNSQLAALKPAEGCEDVASQLRQKISDNMESALDNNLEFALLLTRDGCDSFPDMFFYGIPLPGDPAPAPQADDGGNDSANEYSETNNQVDGVDEADFVKNDGSHVYIVANGKFQIIDAWPAHRVATFDLEGEPKRLFVHADRAVIYSALERLHSPTLDPFDPFVGSIIAPSFGEYTYGYDCEFTGDGRKLRVTILDIRDRADPTLLRELEFTGSYLNSRRIGDIVTP